MFLAGKKILIDNNIFTSPSEDGTISKTKAVT